MLPIIKTKFLQIVIILLINKCINFKKPTYRFTLCTDLNVIKSFPAWSSMINMHFQGKADPNAKDGNGRTALHIAVSQSHKRMVEILLTFGRCFVNTW